MPIGKPKNGIGPSKALTPAPGLLKGDAAVTRQDGEVIKVKKDELLKIIINLEDNQKRIDDLGAKARDIYANAKDKGYSKKILKKVLALRKVPVEERIEEGELLDLYLDVLDMKVEIHGDDDQDDEGEE